MAGTVPRQRARPGGPGSANVREGVETFLTAQTEHCDLRSGRPSQLPAAAFAPLKAANPYGRRPQLSATSPQGASTAAGLTDRRGIRSPMASLARKWLWVGAFRAPPGRRLLSLSNQSDSVALVQEYLPKAVRCCQWSLPYVAGAVRANPRSTTETERGLHTRTRKPG